MLWDTSSSNLCYQELYNMFEVTNRISQRKCGHNIGQDACLWLLTTCKSCDSLDIKLPLFKNCLGSNYMCVL